MKSVLLTTFLFLFLGTINSQIEKGSKYLGGEFNFSINSLSSPNANQSFFSFNLNPTYGFFRKENKAMFFTLYLGFNSSTQNSLSRSNALIGGGFGMSHYFSLVKNLYLDFTGNLSLTYLTDNFFSLNFDIYPRLSYFPLERWQFLLRTGGLNSNVYYGSYHGVKNFGLDASINLNFNSWLIGCNYYLSRGAK